MLEPRRPLRALSEEKRLEKVREVFGKTSALAPAAAAPGAEDESWREVYLAGEGGRKPLGRARFLRALSDCPLCEDIYFLLALNTDG